MNQKPNLPNIAYHYCSSEAFYKIISTKSLWLTNVFETNDYLERKWIDPIIQNVLKEYQPDNDHFKTFKEMLTAFYEKGRDMTPYFTSFSEKEDSLSQWRGYADDGAGFSIGFNLSYFKIQRIIPCTSTNPNDSIGVFKMSYDKNVICANVKAIISKQWGKFQSDGCSPQSSAILSAAGELVVLASAAKNPKFIEEEEWRILYTPIIIRKENIIEIEGKEKDIKFTNRKKFFISSYFDVTFANPSQDMPIKKVFIGPKNISDKDTIKQFLIKNRFKNVEVCISEASYR